MISKFGYSPCKISINNLSNTFSPAESMDVEPDLDCITYIVLKTIDGLFFASTTPPYTEKSTASFFATVLDLRNENITEDFTNSLRA